MFIGHGSERTGELGSLWGIKGTMGATPARVSDPGYSALDGLWD
jgi:hypothetical protein